MFCSVKRTLLALTLAGTAALIPPLSGALPQPAPGEQPQSQPSETAPPDPQDKKAIPPQAEELLNSEDRFSEFITQNLLPAFGDLKDILLTSRPSLSIRITPEGVEIRECAFQFQIKPPTTIQHPLTPPSTTSDGMPDDERQREAPPPALLFEVQCGLETFNSSVTFFEVSMSVLDTDKNPTHYGLKINSLEQVSIKLWGMRAKLHIDSTQRTILMGPKGLTRPFTGEFAKTHSLNEEGLYEVKASLWPPFKSPSPESVVLVKKISVSHTMEIDGSSELSVPVSVEGVRQDTRFRFPFKGQIFFSETGDVIPVMDFSIQ